MTLKARITEDMKSAMRAREAERLGTIRLLLAAIKQKEVDERIELDDAGILLVLEKMVKQRRDSITQFEAAGRQDLVDREQSEMDVLQAYLPVPLTENEIRSLVDQGIRETGAVGMQDMSRVMAWVRPHLAGRAAMGTVSNLVKDCLAHTR